MGRIGITYREVAQTATTLMQQGQQPTIDRIRERLGTGSKTTIAAHLRQWKHENESEVMLTRTSLPPELLSLVQGLWDAMKKTTESEIEALKAKHQDEKQHLLGTIDGLNQQVQSLDQDLESFQQLHQELEKNYETLQSAHQQQTNQLKTVEDKLAIQSAKLDEKKQHIQSQQRQIEQAFANLEHFRAASQEHRQQEQLQADQQRQELQSQIKDLYTDLHEAQSRSTQLKGQCQALEQRNDFLSEEKRYLEDQQAKRALEHQTAVSEQQFLAATNSELKAKNDLLGSRIATLDKELIEKQQTIIALEWERQQRQSVHEEYLDA